MSKNAEVKVMMGERQVGTLAGMPDGMVAFQYSSQWIDEGFSISPISLPLDSRVFIPSGREFEGLFGIFDDSLPDGWGRLLVDRELANRGMKPEEIGPLYRLSLAGKNGRGALEYVPDESEEYGSSDPELDKLAQDSLVFLDTDDVKDIDELYRLGASSGGARPKVLMNHEGEPWIVKFRNSSDPKNIGLMEYEYNLCAVKCGIKVTDFELMPSTLCEGYFASKRFDRAMPEGVEKKIHMASAAGLLESTHRIPALDYTTLFRLSSVLNGDVREREELFRRMCFNVFAHNRDDHSRNFSYLLDPEVGEWHLSPAYDITYSNSIGNQHATSVAGNGEDPQIEDILAVATEAGLEKEWCMDTAGTIREIVARDLRKWLR